MVAYKGEHEDVIRPFVDSMRYKLAANRHKGTSSSWEGLDVGKLLEKLAGEVEELREAITGGNCTEIMLEGADIANFAMIISYIAIRRAAAGRGSSFQPQEDRNIHRCKVSDEEWERRKLDLLDQWPYMTLEGLRRGYHHGLSVSPERGSGAARYDRGADVAGPQPTGTETGSPGQAGGCYGHGERTVPRFDDRTSIMPGLKDRPGG